MSALEERGRPERRRLLQAVHDGLFAKAKKNLDEHIYPAYSLEEAKELQEKHGGFIKTMWCGEEACELKMKERGRYVLPLHPLPPGAPGGCVPHLRKTGEKDDLLGRGILTAGGIRPK